MTDEREAPGAPGPADSPRRGDAVPPEDDTSEGYLCDLCGAVMLERHCKLVCPACGYQRDCSDP